MAIAVCLYWVRKKERKKKRTTKHSEIFVTDRMFSVCYVIYMFVPLNVPGSEGDPLIPF